MIFKEYVCRATQPASPKIWFRLAKSIFNRETLQHCHFLSIVHTHIYICIYNYWHKIKSINCDKLFSIEQHFRLVDHDFTRDAKFTILETLGRNLLDSITMIRETHQNKWILCMYQIPNGLNRKLNNP